MMLLLWSALASAEPYLSDISTEIAVPISALWPIPYSTEVGWVLLMSIGGSLHVGGLDTETWIVSGLHDIADRTDLKDHSIARCPDGSWLHVATAGDDAPNPLFAYDAGFNRIATDALAQGDVPHTINDGIALCNPVLRGAGFAEAEGERDFFFPVGEDGRLTGARVELPDAPRLTGAGHVVDRCDDTRVHISGFSAGPELIIASYNNAYALVDRVEVDLPDEDGTHYYWPTGFIAVEGGYIIAGIGQSREHPWDLDQGNVYLWVLDADFNLVEDHQLTNFTPKGSAAMRPWLDRDGDQLVVAVDKDHHPVLFGATIDLEAMASLGEPCSSPEDTAAPDTAEADSGEPAQTPPVTSAEKGCGGGGGGKAAVLLPAALLGLAWRRRR